MWNEIWLTVAGSVFFVYDHITSSKEVAQWFSLILVICMLAMMVTNVALTVYELITK